MSWDWSSPIALGLFLIMCGGTVLLICVGAAIAASSDRWTVANTRRRR